MNQIKSHSPEYSLKKLNNYDNTVKNSSRIVFENFEVGKFGRRSDVSIFDIHFEFLIHMYFIHLFVLKIVRHNEI